MEKVNFFNETNSQQTQQEQIKNNDQQKTQIKKSKIFQIAQIVQTKQQDKRSVFVQNVDYSVNEEELKNFFKQCGTIKRVTILLDRYTQHPRGLFKFIRCAYIQFEDELGAANAIDISTVKLKGRELTVKPKRTNIKGMTKKKPINSMTPHFMFPMMGRMPYMLPFRRKQPYKQN